MMELELQHVVEGQLDSNILRGIINECSYRSEPSRHEEGTD